MLDDGLNFKSHIKNLDNRLSYNLGIIRRLSQYLPSYILHQLYFSLIQSHLCFGLPAWGSCAPSNLRRTKSLQRKAMEICKISHVALEFNKLYSYCCMTKFMKDYVYDRGRPLYSMIDFATHHIYPTRFRTGDGLIGPIFRKTRCKQSFTYCACRLWNNIPTQIRTCPTLKSFKINLKAYLVNGA